MGEVYRARDTKLNRDVALKVLPDAFASDPDRLARFQREAQVCPCGRDYRTHRRGLEPTGATRRRTLSEGGWAAPSARSPARVVSFLVSSSWPYRYVDANGAS